MMEVFVASSVKRQAASRKVAETTSITYINLLRNSVFNTTVQVSRLP
jgi:hypothetical protein